MDDLRQLPPEWFHYAHVCDAPGRSPPPPRGSSTPRASSGCSPARAASTCTASSPPCPPGIPYALEIPRATLVAQVGAKEHARLAIAAARRHLDAVELRQAS